jgi:hypothetical protein
MAIFRPGAGHHVKVDEDNNQSGKNSLNMVRHKERKGRSVSFTTSGISESSMMDNPLLPTP